jgi:pyruvate,water dikinase
MASRWIRPFHTLSLEDVPLVGGKNASLGELLRNLVPQGVRVPAGFAVTAEAYRAYIAEARLEPVLREILRDRKPGNAQDAVDRSASIREAMLAAPLPAELSREILQAYRSLSAEAGTDALDVAVRSSATAEDLPHASFAGQMESFLHVHGPAEVLASVRKAFASLFTPRAISYREDMGFDHFAVAVSVGVQRMVRADQGAAGVVFTLDPDTGHRGVVLVSSSWGLGEPVVQGRAEPDQFLVHKATLSQGFPALVRKRLGRKEVRTVYDDQGHRQLRDEPMPESLRQRFSLADDDVLQLARWAVLVEQHYSRQHGLPTPMDLEFAKDGKTGLMYLVQARPETVHARRPPSLRLYQLRGQGEVLTTGVAVGDQIATGTLRLLRSAADFDRLHPGDVLVTSNTDPDWEPVMKRAAAIVTDHGGRTSHAAIVARELGIPALVGTGLATSVLDDGTHATVSCAEGEMGRVYRGWLDFAVEEVDPAALPRPRTQILLNLGDPDEALRLALLPSDGVGLARMEFIFASWVRVHPLALTRFDELSNHDKAEVRALTEGYADKRDYFVDRLSQGIALLAAAFWPRPVILRLSDFKTNEYAKLLGGQRFEPREANPMLGWRGASRYDHDNYRDGFLLEAAAVRRVRQDLGLKNLKLMVPFCRTPEEGERVLGVLREAGLRRGVDGLEVYVMAEVPSNVVLAPAFAQLFDGFSIGSNDLTQLLLGVDRDTPSVSHLFDERNPAVRWSCARLITEAHKAGRKVGICGQAPSDFPEVAAFLVEQGIDSISLNPDALLKTTLRIVEVERTLPPAAAAREAMPQPIRRPQAGGAP